MAEGVRDVDIPRLIGTKISRTCPLTESELWGTVPCVPRRAGLAGVVKVQDWPKLRLTLRFT